MNARRLGLAISCVVLGVLAVTGSAQAAFTHQYLSQLTGFGEANAITVGGAGEVYVVDTVSKTVDRFSASGAPLPFTATGSYIEGSKLTGIPGSSPSSEQKAFEAPGGVAVDNESGDVYVSDTMAHVVDVFSSTGSYLFQLTGLQEPGGLAIDQATHDLYLDELQLYTSGHNVEVYSSTGVFLSRINTGPTTSVGVNDLTGDAYALQLGQDRIQIFDSLGSEISDWTGSGTPNGSFGTKGDSETHPHEGKMAVTVDPVTQQVYVAQVTDHVVDQFAASTFEEYEGQLTGTPSGPFTEPTAIAVSPANGDLYVTDGTVVDIFGPDINEFGVTVQQPSNIINNSAILNGRVDPAGVAIESCKFEYGTTTSYGQIATCEPEGPSVGSGNVPVNVVGIPGLQPNTTYHYRLVAVESKGVASVTGDEILTTAGPPEIESASAEVSAGKVGQTTATLHASVNLGQRETTYSFEYGETEAYGMSVPVPSGTIAPGEPIPPAELSGLKADTTYHYRVVASNEYGSVVGPDQQFKTEIALSLDESVSDVKSTSATLDGDINSLGTDTHYYFEYGTADCASSPSSCVSVPATPGTDVPAEEMFQPVAIHLQGLEPSTVYHYELIASNALGVVDGPDDTFVTQEAGGALTLPDGREWEMVSPSNKHGGLIAPIGEESLIQAAANGNGITFVSESPTETEPQGYANWVQVLATRGPDGWSAKDIATRHDNPSGYFIGQGYEYRFFSSDLSQALVEPQGGSFTPLSPEATQPTIYKRANSECETDPECYTPLATSANVPTGTEFGVGVKFLDATPDLKHVVLSVNGTNYEWTEGHLKPVIGGILGREQMKRNAISNDGSRVVSGLSLEDTVSEETVQLDVARPGLSSAGGEAYYQAASADGSRVFFTDSARLTSDSHAAGEESFDLYMCQIARVAGKLVCELTDLTPNGAPGESADIEGHTIAGVSEDGSYVYFVARGVLALGGSVGNPNLYVDHESEGKWTTTFIATLGAEDGADWQAFSSGLQGLTDRVSPDGRYFAFMSSQSLTGYDMRDAVTGQPDEEVYLYDASLKRIVCTSCNPTGARPVGREYSEMIANGNGGITAGDGVWQHGDVLAANIPGWTPFSEGEALYQSRYLSDSGRLFFNSNDALVPQDVNGEEDVYEYEPPGIGDCTAGRATFSEYSKGCVGLISAGTSAEESAFLDASEDGNNVFFLTSAKLLTQDFDSSLDIYDARECSSQSPCIPQAPLPPPACTTGDACKAAPTPQPGIYGSPSSETFSGAGNLTPGTQSVATAKAKRSTRTQLRARALKMCERLKARKKRVVCERQARRAYGSAGKPKTTNQRGK